MEKEQRNSAAPVAASVVSPDMDDKHHKTVTYDPTYARSIYEWKRSGESDYITFFPNLASGEIQSEITENMRIILLDWLTGISEEHHLSSNTYCLAVQLIDFALTLLPVKRSQFQLLGCTCLWLAAKLEEVSFPPNSPPAPPAPPFADEINMLTHSLTHSPRLPLSPYFNRFVLPWSRIFSSCPTTASMPMLSSTWNNGS